MNDHARHIFDLYEHPEIVHYCLDQLFDFRYEYTRRIYEQIPGQVTVSASTRSAGRASSPKVSPEPTPRRASR